MKYEIIKINLTSVMSEEPISDVPCGTCTTCCEKLAPFLTPDEMSSGLYPLSLTNPSGHDLANNPNVGPMVTIYRKVSGGCGMFIDGKCSIYETRPLACRQFDCRKGHHRTIPDLTITK